MPGAIAHPTRKLSEMEDGAFREVDVPFDAHNAKTVHASLGGSLRGISARRTVAARHGVVSAQTAASPSISYENSNVCNLSVYHPPDLIGQVSRRLVVGSVLIVVGTLVVSYHRQMTSQSLILTLHGVAKEFDGDWSQAGYWRDPQGAWRPLHGDRLNDIEEVCLQLHDAFAASLFGKLAYYHALLPGIPDFLIIGGLNSECSLSREQFEQAMVKLKNFPHLHRLLYLYDCRQLVAGIQECTKEVCFLVGEFYRILNLEELFFPAAVESDGTRYCTSPVVTTLVAVLNMVYVRLHSLLDYVTKLGVEIEKLRDVFNTYPKLASSGTLFGVHKRLDWGDRTGTLFEDCDTVHEVELFRNQIIHDGLLDDMPKAYKVVKDGIAIEKFILLPNRVDGQFARYRNRHLFFGTEDKINLRLPRLLEDFQSKQLATLGELLKKLRGRSPQDPSIDTPA